MKRVFVIHGWGGSPDDDFFPWIEEQFLKRGYEIYIPQMPDTENPKINVWVKFLADLIGEPQEADILIGHSIGCQTILRYLQGLNKEKVDQVILVAAWTTLKNLSSDEHWEIAKPWIETPIDFSKAKTHANSIIVIQSDDDPVVPFEENKKVFEDNDFNVIVQHNKGHFNADDGVTEMPVLLELVEK